MNQHSDESPIPPTSAPSEVGVRGEKLLVFLTVFGVLMGGVLLVVVLLGLLFSALWTKREEARHKRCLHNLGILAEAVQQHELQRGFVPTAGFWPQLDPKAQQAAYFQGQGLRWFRQQNEEVQVLLGLEQPLGWGFQLLPQLDLSDVWHRTQMRCLIAGPVPQLICTSRRFRQGLLVAQWDQRQVEYQPSDFAAVDLGTESLLLPVNVCRQYRRPAKLRTWEFVADGRSQTVLVAEKHIPGTLLGTRHPGDWFGFASPWHESVMRRPLSAEAWEQLSRDPTGFLARLERTGGKGALLGPAKDTATVSYPHARFGGSHSQGLVAAMCDGSARTIDFEIDPGVWFYLCHPRDTRTPEP